MTPLDRPIPPTGEEIHIPGGSLQPVGLAAAITVALLGVTIGWVLWVPGVILIVAILWRWIAQARREYEELPAEHHPVAQETIPRPQDRPHGAAESP